MTDLMWDMAHPVGSVLQVAGGFDPNTVRGTWERLEGVFLLASSSAHPAGETGGQANHRHDYAVKTTHYYGGMTTSDGDPDDGFALWDFEQGCWVLGNIDRQASKYPLTINRVLAERMSKEYLGTLNNTKARSGLGTAPSDGDDDNILPPYLAVDTWRRVA